MLQRILNLAHSLLTHVQKMQRAQKDLEVLQEKFVALGHAVVDLAHENDRMRDELRHVRESEKLEREKLVLALQNEMLRFERRLPPESKN